MTAYAFETITPTQALAIQATDTISFTGAAANLASVAYNIPVVGPASITVTFQGHAVEFGMGLLGISEQHGLIFADPSRLMIGGADRDNLYGWVGDDAIFGGQGDDKLAGQGGNDLIQGNAGNDQITTLHGADTVYGGKGDDLIRTGADSPGEAGDFANGNMGDDTLFGGAGADVLLGGRDQDRIFGGEGRDYLSGDLGDDELHGGGGADTLFGAAGDDTIYADAGADVVDGGEGADRIFITGGGGVTVDAGDGDDTIIVNSAGKDILLGGAGGDVFEFVTTTRPTAGQDDEIRDWSSLDRLVFDHFSAQATTVDRYAELVAATYADAQTQANALISGGKIAYVAAQIGGDVVVFAETDGDLANGADTAVVLAGRTLANIEAWNIIG